MKSIPEVPATKPGIKTTEFWTAVIGQILPLLVMVGVITTEDRATLEGALTSAVMAVGALAASVITVWKYIASRTEVKVQELKAQEIQKEKL